MDEERKRLLDEAYELMIRAGWYEFLPEASKIYSHEDLLGLGTVRDEVVWGVEGSANLIRMQGEQSKDLDLKINISPLWRHYSPLADSAILVDEMEVHMTVDNMPSSTYVRVTYVFEFDGRSWKNTHFHTSVPIDSENDAWNKEELKRKNEELQRLVDEQTTELKSRYRELEIEAALERVRSRTLQMRDSNELNDAVAVFFQQFKSLGLLPNEARTYFSDINTDTDIAQVWMTHEDGTVMSGSHFTPLTQSPTISQYYEEFKRGKPLSIRKYTGESLEQYLEFLTTLPHVALDENYQRILNNPPEQIIMTDANFVHGNIGIMTFDPLGSEALDLLQRFAKVFEFTYTRFLDLKTSEMQAREAQIEVALERVRSRTMAMQKSDELKEVIQVVYDQFAGLGILIEHTGFIIDYKVRDDMQIWLADQHEIPTQVTIPYFDCAHWNSFREAKEHGRNFFTNKLAFEEKNKFYQDLFEFIPNVPAQAQEYYFGSPGLAISTVLLDDVGLYIENFAGIPYTDEENETLMRFGTVFQQTYTRFLDLKKTEDQSLVLAREKQRLEKMLNELQATQSQLIQSEKMASLGEMTAGIAHEIQNPLNFINNFSEVNKELLEEIQEAVRTNDLKAIQELANDLIGNEEKITFHGKRADAIVKSMLQHSRGSSGQKELVDINSLCDEYLRLAYHGLRARDKSFNADFKLDLDPALPKVNIVPQDIGRVLLNLINNAFQACNAKQSSLASSQQPDASSSYNPEVTVTTRRVENKIEIRVKDNGNGIPDDIVDKIFQPFFTTKPTGHGTGLGLSMSYDIVKAHGGELKMASRIYEGSEFIVTLPL